MNNSCEDTYFLDRDLAYQIALAHNTFKSENGQWLEQICYYDGAPFDHAPANLVNVPVESFNEYFRAHLHRIPTQVEPTLASHSGNPSTVHEKLSIILGAVQRICRSNYDDKDAA